LAAVAQPTNEKFFTGLSIVAWCPDHCTLESRARLMWHSA
jgi:hypothetical protein